MLADLRTMLPLTVMLGFLAFMLSAGLSSAACAVVDGKVLCVPEPPKPGDPTLNVPKDQFGSIEFQRRLDGEALKQEQAPVQ